ncbi:MAG: glycosyltransferase family 4 protein [Candidatus Krumholzibacteria bacterium]|nr:glycosyltransferase family 4 protein [Candidatus Krumholzibacteria bacterium]
MNGSSDKVRVVLFSDASYTGGAERYLFLLASNLAGRGYTPTLVSCGGGGEGRLGRWFKDSGIDHFRIRWESIFSVVGASSLYKVLKDISPEVFHLNLPGPFDSWYSLVAPVARAAGVKAIVSTEHLPMVDSFMKGRILKGVGSRHIDRVITVSSDNIKHLTDKHKISQSRIRVVYNGIPDPGRPDPSDIFDGFDRDEGYLRLVSIGSIESRKGQDTLIESMRLLPDKVVLALIGEGEMKGELEQRVTEYGLSDRVIFAGYRDDIAGIIDSADILVVSSLLEATPYVIMEAFAGGLPVVATNIFGIPELVGDGRTGFLVDHSRPEGIADTVNRLYEDRDLLARMGNNARVEFEDRFRIERSVADTIAVYDEILEYGAKR